jgi:hypothetical protein
VMIKDRHKTRHGRCFAISGQRPRCAPEDPQQQNAKVTPLPILIHL